MTYFSIPKESPTMYLLLERNNNKQPNIIEGFQKQCKGVPGVAVTDQWCMDNCNHPGSTFCPASYCNCDGDGPTDTGSDPTDTGSTHTDCDPFSGPKSSSCICTSGWGSPADTIYSDGFPSGQTIQQVDDGLCGGGSGLEHCDPKKGPSSNTCYCSIGWTGDPNDILYTVALDKSNTRVKRAVCPGEQCDPLNGPETPSCICTTGWGDQKVYFSEGVPSDDSRFPGVKAVPCPGKDPCDPVTGPPSETCKCTSGWSHGKFKTSLYSTYEPDYVKDSTNCKSVPRPGPQPTPTPGPQPTPTPGPQPTPTPGPQPTPTPGPQPTPTPGPQPTPTPGPQPTPTPGPQPTPTPGPQPTPTPGPQSDTGWQDQNAGQYKSTNSGIQTCGGACSPGGDYSIDAVNQGLITSCIGNPNRWKNSDPKTAMTSFI